MNNLLEKGSIQFNSINHNWVYISKSKYLYFFSFKFAKLTKQCHDTVALRRRKDSKILKKVKIATIITCTRLGVFFVIMNWKWILNTWVESHKAPLFEDFKHCRSDLCWWFYNCHTCFLQGLDFVLCCSLSAWYYGCKFQREICWVNNLLKRINMHLISIV